MTTIHTETRRTYTDAGPTPSASDVRRALTHARQLARTMGDGWEHYVGDICYVASHETITRIAYGPDGQHLSERRMRIL